MSHACPAPSLPPTIFDRAVDKVVISFKDWRFNRAKAALEHELARIVETANGHQAKHLPTGSPTYVALYGQAMNTIETFCAKHHVERLSIEQEVPVLRELESLTHVPSPVVGLSKGLVALLAAIAGAILMGVTGGLMALGYHWVGLLVH